MLLVTRRSALALTGAVAIGGSAGAQNTGVAKIGIVQSTSGGSAALYGIPQKQAAELAIAEINAASGPGAIKLEGLHQDDGGDRGQTVNVYQRLIRQDKVVAILGPTLSNSAFAADPVAQQAGIPVIASSNTASGVTKIGSCIFRTSVPEDQIFPAVLRYAVAHKGIKRVALIYGLDDAISRSAHEVEKQAAAALSLEVMGIESFQKGDVDFSPQLTKLLGGKPDALVLGSLAEEAAAIVRQARQLGFPESTVFIGNNATISSKLFELAGPAATGFLAGAVWFPGFDNSRSRAMVAAYEAKYKMACDIFAAQAYDAAYVLAEAIRQANTTTDGKLIRDKLEAIKDFSGVLGTFGWSAERDATVQAKVLMGNGQSFVPAPTV